MCIRDRGGMCVWFRSKQWVRYKIFRYSGHGRDKVLSGFVCDNSGSGETVQVPNSLQTTGLFLGGEGYIR